MRTFIYIILLLLSFYMMIRGTASIISDYQTFQCMKALQWKWYGIAIFGLLICKVSIRALKK